MAHKDGTTMQKVKALLCDVPIAEIQRTNGADRWKVREFTNHPLVIRGAWPFPPVLVVDRDSSVPGSRKYKRRYLLCDGNHRVASIRKTGAESIRAWMVRVDDLNAYWIEHHGRKWDGTLWIESHVQCGRSPRYPHRT